MKILRFCSLLALSLPAFTVSAAEPRVLASVHPLGLVAASVVSAEQLSVLVPPGMTPHDFSLRPSDVEKIQAADVILWSGAEGEPYLAGFAKRWPDKQWIDVSAFAADGHHDDDAQDGHDDHDHQRGDSHRDGDVHDHGDDAHDHAGHHHDPHWWLNPEQMVAAQRQLAQRLGRDPAPFAAAVEQQLAASQQTLSPLRGRGFFVFHRAWDHWVEHFGLNQVGAFTLTPEQKPGLKTLQSMRTQIEQGNVVCVFSEPEFSPALVESVVRGTGVRRGELDPMALNIPLTVNGYPAFLSDLTQRFETCLKNDR
ncbi:zinc ABC transporter substrate-binding protein [Thalassolituus sp. LLYu03]|uniref:zinc ABC transporter substrate-binding protein n=1 Tax=Thalassolituus sp. LLYu03 TaxID=3421656 RepID=UPI003D2CEA66